MSRSRASKTRPPRPTSPSPRRPRTRHHLATDPAPPAESKRARPHRGHGLLGALALIAAGIAGLVGTQVGGPPGPRLDRARRFREQVGRAGLRLHAPAGAGRAAQPVAVPQHRARRARARDAPAHGTDAGRSPRPRRRARGVPPAGRQGDAGGLDRQPGQRLRAGAGRHQLPDRGSHRPRAGGGERQGAGAGGARQDGFPPARHPRRIAGLDQAVRRPHRADHDAVAGGPARLHVRAARAGAGRGDRIDRVLPARGRARSQVRLRVHHASRRSTATWARRSPRGSTRGWPTSSAIR